MKPTLLSPAIHQDLVHLVAEVTGIAPEKIDLTAHEIPTEGGMFALSLHVKVNGRSLTSAEERTIETLLMKHFREARELRDVRDPASRINCKMPNAIN